MKIWIVDPDAPTRLLLRTLIQEQDAESTEIVEMASAEQTLQHLENGEQPDVFLVDLGTEGTEGLELCKILRDRDSGGSEFIPYIIATTLAHSEEIASEVLEAGANDYLAKPVNRKVLHTRLRVAGKLVEHARNQEIITRTQSVVSFALAYASVPAAIVDIRNPDVFAYIVYANKALLSLIESDPDAVLGHSLATFQSWHPEMSEGIATCFAAGKPFVCRLVTGSPYFTSLDLRISGYPICPPEGEMVHYLILEERMAAS